MIRFWQRRFQEGVKTELLELDKELEAIKKELRNTIKKRFASSLAIRMVDSGSCNGCEAECNALSNPYYDMERLGIRFVASPRHADILLVSGVVTFNMMPHLIDAYHQLPEPKWIITIGDCATLSGDVERTCLIKGPVSDHIPVAYHIAGCPPEPAAIMRGLLAFLKEA